MSYLNNTGTDRSLGSWSSTQSHSKTVFANIHTSAYFPRYTITYDHISKGNMLLWLIYTTGKFI